MQSHGNKIYKFPTPLLIFCIHHTFMSTWANKLQRVFRNVTRVSYLQELNVTVKLHTWFKIKFKQFIDQTCKIWWKMHQFSMIKGHNIISVTHPKKHIRSVLKREGERRLTVLTIAK